MKKINQLKYNLVMEKMLMLFLDGVGIGDGKSGNPFFETGARHLPFYHSGLVLPDGTPVKPIDCSLGLPGIPQSATCQTALFTGAAGSELGGEHLQGYPNRLLRRLIARANLFSLLSACGKRCRFLNAYPFHARYFSIEHLRIDGEGRLHFSPEFPLRWKRHISVTTCMLVSNQQPPLDEEALKDRTALYQDFSNRSLIGQGARLPIRSEEDAADILALAAAPYDFALYEYFQTDLVAHRQGQAEVRALVSGLDRLLERLLGSLDRDRDTLILTSDHGNCEDLSSRGHTRNPVPLIAWGKHGKALRSMIQSIADVTPAIVRVMAGNSS